MRSVVARHVFSRLPKWCAGIRPGLLWVRCPKCGRPHQEYFGPRNRDELRAEVQFFRDALEAAFGIVSQLHPPHARRPRRRRQ